MIEGIGRIGDVSATMRCVSVLVNHCGKDLAGWTYRLYARTKWKMTNKTRVFLMDRALLMNREKRWLILADKIWKNCCTKPMILTQRPF
jgi:hypothetical protein